jgi:hypothetical protein
MLHFFSESSRYRLDRLEALVIHVLVVGLGLHHYDTGGLLGAHSVAEVELGRYEAVWDACFFANNWHVRVGVNRVDIAR